MNKREVIAFLSDPASYPAKPKRVERFETHGALVFLAGEEAWKIKRAVRFPYMDFSTLEKRKAACEREVEINRRLAPECICGVTPITRSRDGRVRLRRHRRDRRMGRAHAPLRPGGAAEPHR